MGEAINVIEEDCILRRVQTREASIKTDGGWIFLRMDKNRATTEHSFTSIDEFRTFLKMLMRFDERL
jgi:hypothetical protein